VHGNTKLMQANVF